MKTRKQKVEEIEALVWLVQWQAGENK